MSYYLGIDLGTTYTGAARFSDGRGEIITLGDRAAVVPSVLFFRDDGDVLAGDPAVRRGITDPTRVVREFKRRIGDPTPIMVGPSPYSADALMGELLDTILGVVSRREGGPPEGLGITHPANWGPYKLDILHQAIRLAEVGAAIVLSEPEAAAIHYAWTERLEPGEVVAVYDLGGGTFDAAVLRKTDNDQRFEILGEAEGIERLGGVDFDEAVFQYVLRFLGSAMSELDIDDQATIQGLARLRQECVNAKEALSSDTDVSIPVFLPTIQTEVRLTRPEFEAMIRPALSQTIEALRRALRGAKVEAEDLAAVLLVGGSSRIPLVAQLVAAEVGRPIAVDIHPKHTVAMGAAIASAYAAGRAENAKRSSDAAVVAPPPEVPTEPLPSPVLAEPSESSNQPEPSELPDQSEAPGSSRPPATPPGVDEASSAASTDLKDATSFAPVPAAASQRTRRRTLIGSGLVAVLAVVGVMALIDRDDSSALGVTPTTLSEASATTPAEQVTSTTVGATTTTNAFTTTTAIALRDPEPLQVRELAAGETFPVRAEAGDSADEVGGLISLTTFTTTGRFENVDGAEWLEVAEPVSGWVSAAAVQPVEAGDRVTITGITVEDGRYVVDYTANYEPLISDGEAVHIHFYFDSVPIEEAGVPGNGPWILYDIPAPFSEYGVDDRPDDATRMCATPATADHRVVNERVFHCMDLPDAGSVRAPDSLTVGWSERTPGIGPCRLGSHIEV